MDIFRYDSDFMQALGRIADLAWLNILCAICCFPIFTAGAAVTAKYYTAMKLERGQAPGVTKTFFRAFKENFLQDLKVTVILILICAFFAYDWLYIYKQGVGSLSPVVIGFDLLPKNFEKSHSLVTPNIQFCIGPKKNTYICDGMLH